MLVDESPFDTDTSSLEARPPYWAQVKCCLPLECSAVMAASSANLMHMFDKAVDPSDTAKID